MSLALTSRRAALLPGRWVSNELWRRARAVPSLDLRFAENKSLLDSVSGQNLITFTRASTGTYVDSDGTIRSAATNLLLRSEEFGTTWSALNVTVSGDSTAAPNGSVVADTIVPAASTAAHLISQAVTVAASTPHTASIYIKSDGAPFVQVVYDNGASAGAFINVNLATGAATRGPEVAGAATSATGSVFNVGNGYYRISVGATHSGTVGRILVSPLPSGQSSVGINPSTTTTASDKVIAWGAQLEVGSTATTYIPTGATINSAPRFDHNPLTGECLGLLVEEQRQNLLLRSEEFGTTWATTDATVPTSTETTPAGTSNGNVLTANGISAVHSVLQNVTYTAASHTLSVYAKKGTNNFIQLRFGAAAIAAGNGFANFDLNAGVVGTIGSGTSASSITAIGNGWYRCSITGTTAAASSNAAFYVVTSATATSAEVNTLTTTVHIWGAQLEVGAFPTSYIPTTGTAATRTADVASISGTNFSSWFSAGEGTLYGECATASPIAAGASRRIANITDGTEINRITIGWAGAIGAAAAFVTTANAAQAVFASPSGAYPLPTRVALSYQLNNFNASVNGSTFTPDTAGSVPVVNQMTIGDVVIGGSGPQNINGAIRRITFFPRALSSTLQSITL